MSLLRTGVLAECQVALAGAPPPSLAEALRELGATVQPRPQAPVNALVVDHSGAAPEALPAELWDPILSIAAEVIIPAGQPAKVVLIAPRPDAGVQAEVARAAIENLARTLSVEWARYTITVTALAPGVHTTDAELATVVAYLLSPGGDYFSGCRFELGATRTRRP